MRIFLCALYSVSLLFLSPNLLASESKEEPALHGLSVMTWNTWLIPVKPPSREVPGPARNIRDAWKHVFDNKKEFTRFINVFDFDVNRRAEAAADYIADQINRHSLDVIFLQEVWSNDHSLFSQVINGLYRCLRCCGSEMFGRSIIVSALDLHNYNFTKSHGGKKLSPNSKLFDSGLLIASPHKIIAEGFVPFEGCTGVDRMVQKGTMVAIIEIKAGTEYIVASNTHYDLEKANFAERTRVSLNFIHKMISDHIPPGSNFNTVFAGDFNTYKKADKNFLLETLKNAGFINASSLSRSKLSPPTWNGFPRLHVEHDKSDIETLDYIFIRSNKNYQNRNFSVEFVKDPNPPGLYTQLSDHASILALWK